MVWPLSGSHTLRFSASVLSHGCESSHCIRAPDEVGVAVVEFIQSHFGTDDNAIEAPHHC